MGVTSAMLLITVISFLIVSATFGYIIYLYRSSMRVERGLDKVIHDYMKD
jgi:uncharacterized protein YbbC (DUF1343 family)